MKEWIKATRVCTGCGQMRLGGRTCLVCMSTEWRNWKYKGESLEQISLNNPGYMYFDAYPVARLVTSPNVGKWCRLPYPGHPRGCPNFGKKPHCPPNVIPIDRFIDISLPMYLVRAQFNLRSHAERMKSMHPGWTNRQCRSVLYWQNSVRAKLRDKVRTAMSDLSCDAVTFCPEGMGLNVFVTARLAGLRLDKTRRLEMDNHVALIGSAKSEFARGLSSISDPAPA